ncbi:MAG: response regulator transcription factor [Rhodospirillales bacterium]|nr:response regulator transcription factor [Rhodospirillales bacterium]
MRIIAADDHPLYLEAICTQILRAFEGAEILPFFSLDDALAALPEKPTDLVLLDLSMPGMNGAEGVKKAVAAAGKTPVAILSGVANKYDVTACISSGARGFFTKTMESRILTNAISVVLYGGTYVPTEYINSLSNTTSPNKQGQSQSVSQQDLSDRDINLLRMITEGYSNKEIARKLDLQEVTIKFYVSRLFRLLGVKNRAQAAVKALQLGAVVNAQNDA